MSTEKPKGQPPSPVWTLSDDRTTVTVSLPTEPLGEIKFQLDAAGVDEMLRALGDYRDRMQPPIPMKWTNFPFGNAVLDPPWFHEPDNRTGMSVLHIRDAGFGWRHFLFPHTEGAKLGNLLQRQAKRKPPPSTPA